MALMEQEMCTLKATIAVLQKSVDDMNGRLTTLLAGIATACVLIAINTLLGFVGK